MPHCYMLHYIISNDMRNVMDMSVLSSYIVVSSDMQNATIVSLLSSFNTGSDQRLICVTFNFIYRPQSHSTNGDFKYRQGQRWTTSGTMAGRNFEKSRRVVDTSHAL
uniref:Uncharacterized protein n=1 Tax=Plectus sambesii TaxID=2011161 RepID=A0A914VHK0_9BILA